MRVAGEEKATVVTHIISGDLWAGAEAQVYQLISGLYANGHVAPTAVVFNPGILYDKLCALGIEVTIADETALSPLGQIMAIRAHLRENGAAIVHTHGFKENVLGTIAQHLARVPRSLRTAHGNPETTLSWQKPLKKLTQILDDSIARYGQNAVVAVSKQLESALSARYPGKTVRISNFIDLNNRYASEEAEITPVKEHEPPYQIALIGRAVPVKRLDLFIDTIALLRNQHGLDVNGAIYGDGPLLSSMKDYAAKRIEGAVEFKGFVNNIAQELTTTDVLVMPSDHEGLPMTLLEALAIKVPIVAHNIGGIPEVLGEGRCGVLVDNHDSAGYAEAIAKLLNNRATMHNLAEAGVKHLQREFGSTQNIQKYEELYATLVRGTGSPHRSHIPNGSHSKAL
ncbi:glycosyltransferase family 4 protein [Marinobacter fonticola]|uniref:glycosyltransferase family 4 protein n=1 Tax=Marinobacter fonticola TaxID=2603215 RepID=UPI0011E74548|nr:glycosyltransferase family 4 protein [Marinobacter fonticola]